MYRKQSFLFILVCLISGLLSGQPRLTVNLSSGIYEPDLTGFDDNTLLESSGFFSRNVLPGFGAMFEFYPNARVGFSRLSSYQSGETPNGARYSRSLIYRMIKVETFFNFFRRFEMNFVLAPTYNRGYISLDSESESSDWKDMLGEYGNGAINISSSTDMTTTWWGFVSEIGIRFYLMSWLALDLRTGFMKNGYDAGDWTFQGEKVKGPALKIGDLPLLTFQVVFKIR